jgi:hypothetical protein
MKTSAKILAFFLAVFLLTTPVFADSTASRVGSRRIETSVLSAIEQAALQGYPDFDHAVVMIQSTGALSRLNDLSQFSDSYLFLFSSATPQFGDRVLVLDQSDDPYVPFVGHGVSDGTSLGSTIGRTFVERYASIQSVAMKTTFSLTSVVPQQDVFDFPEWSNENYTLYSFYTHDIDSLAGLGESSLSLIDSSFPRINVIDWRVQPFTGSFSSNQMTINS